MTVKTHQILALVTGMVIITATTLAAQVPPKLKMTTDIPASITTPDRVETPIGTLGFFDGVPIG